MPTANRRWRTCFVILPGFLLSYMSWVRQERCQAATPCVKQHILFHVTNHVSPRWLSVEMFCTRNFADGLLPRASCNGRSRQGRNTFLCWRDVRRKDVAIDKVRERIWTIAADFETQQVIAVGPSCAAAKCTWLLKQMQCAYSPVPWFSASRLLWPRGTSRVAVACGSSCTSSSCSSHTCYVCLQEGPVARQGKPRGELSQLPIWRLMDISVVLD